MLIISSTLLDNVNFIRSSNRMWLCGLCVQEGKQFWSHTLWDGGPARWGPCDRSTRTRGEVSASVEKPRWDSPGWRVSVAAQTQSEDKQSLKREPENTEHTYPHKTRRVWRFFGLISSNKLLTDGNKHAVAPDNPSPSCPIYELPVSCRPRTLPPTAWLIKPLSIVSEHLW